MNHILKELIDEGHVVVYLDDILIFTAEIETHRYLVRRVLEILQENKLYLKPEKCTFEAWEVEYLGLIVGHGTMWMDPVKIKAVNEWPKPKNKKQLQRFLGFCNFYRRFIKNYSKIARPLHDLTGNKMWDWTEA